MQETINHCKNFTWCNLEGLLLTFNVIRFFIIFTVKLDSFFLFTYSLKHSFQCIITELIGEWKLEISLSKSIYSSAVKSYSASFISVSSLKSSENSSFNSDSSFSTLCCTIPHFAKQFLIVVFETSFQGAATHVIPWGMSKSLAISDALRSFEILGITWRNKFFLIFYLEVFNDACI